MPEVAQSVDVLTFNGIEYVPKSSMTNVPEIAGDVKIVILQRGWNMVGRLERLENGLCKLHNASVLRRWGTTKGLGQIAKDGPTTNTILDKCNGEVEFDSLTIVATIACEENKWSNVL